MLKGNEHIVFLVPGFAQNESDTSSLPYFQDYLKSLLRSWPDLTLQILALHHPNQVGVYEWFSIPVHTCSKGAKRFPMKLMNWFRAEKQMRKIHAEKKIDLIHSLWLSDTSWIGGRLSQELDIPILATAMGQDVLQSNKYFRRQRRDLPIVCVSKRHAAFMHASFDRKCQKIIPWGIHRSDFPETVNQNRPIDIIGVGNLGPIKDYMTFLDVIEYVLAKGAKPNVLLIGDGKGRKEIETRIQKKGLPVSLTGHLPRTQVFEKMSESKVLLHTSTYESQGFVFLEALASGCKIVSTPVGMAEDDRSNWKVRKDVRELADGCLELMPLENHARQIEESFLVEQTTEDYTTLYSQMIYGE